MTIEYATVAVDILSMKNVRNIRRTTKQQADAYPKQISP